MTHLAIRLGDIQGASGSSYVELRDTKVFAAVHGPTQPTSPTQESAHFVTLECIIENAWDDSRHYESLQHKLSHTIRSVLNKRLYVKTLITLTVSVIDEGNALSDAATLAASLALVDAGISIKDFVVSCTVAISEEGNECFLQSDKCVRVAVLPSNGRVVETDVIGTVTPQELKDAVESWSQSCKDLTSSIREFISTTIL